LHTIQKRSVALHHPQAHGLTVFFSGAEPPVVAFDQEIENVPEVVAKAAESVIKEKDDLHEIAPAAQPSTLFDGDMYLRIADTPFVLYLQATNHHTKARSESRKLNLSERAKQQAKAFFQEVAHRAASAGR